VVTSTASTSVESRLRHHHHNNPPLEEGLEEQEKEDCESVEETSARDTGQPTKRLCGSGGGGGSGREDSSSACPRVCHGEKSNKPICGSDGRLYATHCDLRRWSCLTKSHVYPVNHSLCPPHNNHHHFSKLSSRHQDGGGDEEGIEDDTAAAPRGSFVSYSSFKKNLSYFINIISYCLSSWMKKRSHCVSYPY